MNDTPRLTRRSWLATALMGGGLLLSYGALAVQGFLYLLPPQAASRTRKLFAGRLADFAEGAVRGVADLEGNQVLVKHGKGGLRAFSSVCPHLGCRVHWEAENGRFFCPCHRGVFNEEGIAVEGPPADAGQRLAEVPLTLDAKSGVVYLQVKAPGRG